jgi:hypothetical protein
MDKQKFKKGDSIEKTVELLETIHKEKEKELEERGLGKKTKKIGKAVIVTKKAPEIPLELPPGYFSNITPGKLKRLRKESEKQRRFYNTSLEKVIEKQDAMSSTVGVEESINRLNSLQEQIAHWSRKLKYIDFLIEEIDRAILNSGKPSKIVFKPGTKLLDSVKLLGVSDFSSEYFSGLDLSVLKETRDAWEQELKNKRKKLENKEKILEETRKLIRSDAKRENLITRKIDGEVLSREDNKLWDQILLPEYLERPSLAKASAKQKEKWEEEMPKILLVRAIREKNKLERDEISQVKKIETLKDNLQAMGLLLSMLIKLIDGEFDIEKLEKETKLIQKKEKVVKPVRDPILEDIKKKMGMPHIKREPLPKMSKIKEVERKPLTQTIFDEGLVSKIQKLFEDSKSKRGLEIEASFGYYDDRGFNSGTGSGIYFSNLLNRIKAAISEKKGKTSVEYTNTRVDSRKTFGQPKGQYDRASNVRRIVDLDKGGVVWQYKSRYSTIDNRIWGIRISESTEKYLSKGGKSSDRGLSTLGDLGIDPETWEPTTTRFRRRTSFIGTSKSSLFYGVKVELTTVRQINYGKNNKGFTTFEIEIERDSDNITARHFTDILTQLYKWMFGDYSHSIFISELIQSSAELPKVKWDKKNRVFSDGSFAYKTKEGEKAYGKIVQESIRVLTSEEQNKLKASGIDFKCILREGKMNDIRESARRQKLFKLKTWDENLKIFTDGIYAYFVDKDRKLKVYAIIVGPEKLSESDKEQLKRMKKKFSDMTQAEVNATTVKIRKGAEKRKEKEEETVEIYRKPGTGYKRVFKEKEIIWDPDHIMTLEERRRATELHNELFQFDMRKKRIAPERETKCVDGELTERGSIRKLRPYQLWSDYWNKPQNIKLKNFLDPRSKWALTLKYDGVRSFLFIHEYGTYMVSPPYTLIYMGEGDKNMSGTLLDGEFMSDLDKITNSYTRITFWAFDLLFYRDEDYRGRVLVDRLSALDNSVKRLKEDPGKYPYLKMKKYIMKDSPIFEQIDPGQIMEKFEEYDPVKELDIYENIKKLLQENKNLLRKITSLLEDVQVPQEMLEITIKRIEEIVKKDETDEDEHFDKITEVLKSIDLDKRQRKAISTEVKNFLREDEEIVEKTDGLILQPYIWYCNKYTFKWKPPVQLTIDFYLQRMTSRELSDRNIEVNPDQYYYLTMVGGDRSRDKKVDMSIFRGDYDNPYIGYIKLDSNTIEEDGEPIDGRVVECEWDKDVPDPDFYPIRIREDKIRPNNYYPAAISVWQDINDPITRDSIEGINLKIMRKYHNEVKFDLLKSFEPGATILDIGSGRGGDILKWRSLGFKNVYALEPNSETLETFQSRLKKDMENNKKKKDPSPYPRVEILNYGAEKYKNINNKLNEDKVVLDGIVSFFSLTFFPKDKKTYKNLLKTISLIPPGGKFVGIVLSGEKVKNLLDTSNSAMIKDYKEGFMVKGYTQEDKELEVYGGIWDKSINAWTFDDYSEKKNIKNYIKVHKTYKCDAFTIQQKEAFFDQTDEGKDNDEICNAFIGDEIEIDLRGKGDDQSTMVKSQTEWLFDFNYFKKKMKEMNFSLVESRTLSYPVTGPNDNVSSYQNLPKDSQTFSSLNKVFIFKKKGKTVKEESKADEVASFLDPDEVEPIKLKSGGVEYDDIERVGIIQSHASFIHCVLQALDSKYRKMDITEREARVNKLRETLAKDLTLKEFLKLRVAAKELGSVSKRERALEGFKEILKDAPHHHSSGSLLGELEMTELLSKRYEVNIYVVGVTGSLEDITFVKPSTLFADQCDTLYKYDKSIVLIRLPRLLMKEGYHEITQWYDLLKPSGKKNTAVFPKDSEFVQQLYQEICG